MTAYHSNYPFFYHPGGAGFTVSVYQVNTVIPITTYADKDKSASNPWPVVLSNDGQGNGVGTIYIDSTYATITLKDLDGVPVYGYPATWVKPAQQADLDLIDARLTAEEGINDTQISQIAALQAADIALDVRLDAAEATIVIHTSAIGNLLIADIALDGRLDAAEATIISHTNSIANLVIADTHLDVRLDAAEATIISHTSSIGNLVNADIALDGRLDAAEATIISLDGRLDIAEPAITSLDGRLDILEPLVTGLDGRIDALELIDHSPPTGNAAAFREPTTNVLVQTGASTTTAFGSKTITFPTAYTSAPIVMASIDKGPGFGGDLLFIAVHNVTTTQFEVDSSYADGTVDGGIIFHWLSVGTKT